MMYQSISTPPAAAPVILSQTTAPQSIAQVVKACPYDGFPKFYSRVRTNQGDPLRVRSTPNGKPIGSIPDKWAVVVLEWSRNGVWARVTSHWNDDSPRFGSASDFRGGWVAAAYLEDIGRFCEKPEAVAQVDAPQVFGAVPVMAQQDWLAMGDALSATIPA
jgi:hypothetical protein